MDNGGKTLLSNILQTSNRLTEFYLILRQLQYICLDLDPQFAQV
jgi:hypothetical protein